MHKRKLVLIIIASITILISLLGIFFLTPYLKRITNLSTKPSVVAQQNPPHYLYSLKGEKDANTKRNAELSPEGFRQPMAVAVAPDGRIFVADTGNRRIIEFGANRSFSRSFGSDTLEYPSGLLYVNSRLYVVDSNLMKIAVYNDLGEELPPLLNKMVFPKEGVSETAAETLVRPTALQLDAKGLFYVADVANQCIIVLDPTGKFIRSFGTGGNVDGSFQFPGGLAVLNNGDIYVADSNNARIQVFNSSGHFLTKIDGSQSNSGHTGLPRGLALRPDGTIIVADVFSHRVRAFDLTGKELWSIGEIGNKEGQFYFPNNLCLDSEGRIYVADRENNRIQVFGN